MRTDDEPATRLRRVGVLDLRDLDVIAASCGYETLPYPFMFTRRSRWATEDEAAAHASDVRARFRDGDLTRFAEAASAFTAAEIRVECHVQYLPATTPSVRVLGFRSGQLGFVARQRVDEDGETVAVDALSPYDLGTAIRDAVPLTRPGRHRMIVVPEYAPTPRDDDEDLVVQMDTGVGRRDVVVPSRLIRAYGVVQSHWTPARTWGPDRLRPKLTWLGVQDDGDYLLDPTRAYATPLTPSMLREAIDRLIADDVAALRARRGDGRHPTA
jgi:hypothetical protein